MMKKQAKLRNSTVECLVNLVENNDFIHLVIEQFLFWLKDYATFRNIFFNFVNHLVSGAL